MYLCYGIHHLLNVVTNREGEGAAVLIRSAEAVSGLATIRRRRGGLEGPRLLTGPGKVGAALGLDTTFSGHALTEFGGLELREGPRVEHVAVGPRIGIDYAEAEHVRAPWRLAEAGSRWVSYRKTLREPAE